MDEGRGGRSVPFDRQVGAGRRNRRAPGLTNRVDLFALALYARFHKKNGQPTGLLRIGICRNADIRYWPVVAPMGTQGYPRLYLDPKGGIYVDLDVVVRGHHGRALFSPRHYRQTTRQDKLRSDIRPQSFPGFYFDRLGRGPSVGGESRQLASAG